MQKIYEERRKKLKEQLNKEDLDAYLVLHPANRFYLSGFELHDPQCNESSGFLLICSDGRDWLFTDPRYQEAAKRLWEEEQIFIYSNGRNKQVSEFLQKSNFKKVGLETKTISYDFYSSLKKAGLQLIAHSGLVEGLRMLKDEKEVELLRKSCRLNHLVFSNLENMLDFQVTENMLAWEIEKTFRDNGASELAFPAIVASGKNSALPHYSPQNKYLEKNTPLLVDIGGRLENYCSDQTRTLWLGAQPTDQFKSTLELVRKGQALAIEKIRPGVKANELLSEVKNFFAEKNVAEYFTHALGHGIGLETHEAPGLGPKNETKLKPGMVITIEPGLYFPGWGGVRWEHMVLVTETGAEVL